MEPNVADLHLVEFWKQRADIELTKPRSQAVPHRWRWRDIEPQLRAAAKTVPIEECERRALVFANPGLGGKPYITNTIFAAYSLYNPGEQAPVPGWHWHEHVNTGHDDVMLYSVTDEPVMRKLGLYRAEGRAADGAVLRLDGSGGGYEEVGLKTNLPR